MKWEVSKKGNHFTVIRGERNATITVFFRIPQAQPDSAVDMGWTFCIARSKSDIEFSKRTYSSREAAKTAAVEQWEAP